MISSNPCRENLIFKQNREQSWLRFNQRILEEADDPTIPILDRLKFVSIYATNLDEFFMIRVGSLYDKSVYTPKTVDSKSGLTPGEQLSIIYDMVRMQNDGYNHSYLTIESVLRDKGISSLHYHELKSSEKKFVKTVFKESVYPILSPQIVDTHHPFPHLINKNLYIACMLKRKDKNIFGIIPVPDKAPPVIFLPGEGHRYIPVERVILEYADELFDSYKMSEKSCISVTRNADITSEDDTNNENQDFRIHMKELLHLRKRLAVVRLETSKPLGKNFTEYLTHKLEICEKQIYIVSAPLRMNYVLGLIGMITETANKMLLYPAFTPVNSIASNTDMLSLVTKRDLLLHFPYVSMRPFLHLIRQAAHDPNVLSIKITIYRLAMKASLVDHLCAAAENGKDVTVMIELRARFDEQNNIDWSEKLEDAGCKILYGFEEHKSHAKICLITYREKGRIKFITQIGTGNYNEKTAELYTDLSLITANDEIGQDATIFFKNMSIGNLEGHYKHLLVAPFSLKPRLLDMIDDEIKKGVEGKIFFKINSITDVDLINKLTEASIAGVQVTMVVRGICCILPGVPSMTENIQIRSIVGRFLEHSRIYSFGSGSTQKLYISSADLMTRNLDRRVEVACPILQPEVKGEINAIIQSILSDNVKARTLDSNGLYHRLPDSRPPINSQEIFIQNAQTFESPSAVVRRSLFNQLQKLFKIAN